MRTARVLLSLLVLAVPACGGGPDASPDAAPDPSASSAPSAPRPDPEAGAAIPGVVLWDYEAPDHVTQDVVYEQQPPAYGAHWVPRDLAGNLGWLDCGTYDEPVPEEFAVHSMEHGAVWLTYRPGAPGVEQLQALAELQPDYVLVSPYEGQREPFVATTWDAQLRVEAADDPRLAQFVRAWAGGPQGREQGAPCEGGTSLEDARSAVEAAPGGQVRVPARPPRG